MVLQERDVQCHFRVPISGVVIVSGHAVLPSSIARKLASYMSLMFSDPRPRKGSQLPILFHGRHVGALNQGTLGVLYTALMKGTTSIDSKSLSTTGQWTDVRPRLSIPHQTSHEPHLPFSNLPFFVFLPR
jgi:hypothetical protein